MALKKADDTTPAEHFSDLTDKDVPASVPAVVTAGPAALGAFEGDNSVSDLRLPRLQIAYGVGSLSETFNPGDWVLGGDSLLAKKGDPLNLIILFAKQYWKEYLTREQYAAKAIPRTFLTVDEVQSHGGTVTWSADGVGPTFGKALNMRLLIEQPEGLICGMFGVQLSNGKNYAPAVWDVDKTAYKRVGPVVESTAKFCLRPPKNLVHGVFQVTTRSEKINNNLTVVPMIKLLAMNSQEVITDIQQLILGVSPTAEPPQLGN